mgnify:CR=1 FL=1
MAPMFTLTEREAGHFRADGSLLFSNAAEAFGKGLAVLAATKSQDLHLDCSGISSSDSAGLAVLVEWLAWARRSGRHLKLQRVPTQLQDIARISELEDLLAEGI